MQPVEIRLTGTVLACRPDTLPTEVSGAMQSQGRSALERLLPWGRVARLIVVTTDWIVLFHANGYFSRVGRRLPEDPVERFQALAERERIRINHGQGVEDTYGFQGEGQWRLQSFQGESLRRTEPRMLSEVVTKLPSEQVQAALDLDPKGASLLSPTQLDDGERRVLRSLIDEWPYNTVDHLRIELTRDPELGHAEIERALDLLLARGYVEEFEVGHWQVTETARHIRHRLLGSEPVAA